MPQRGSIHLVLSKLQAGDHQGAAELTKNIPYPIGDMLHQGTIKPNGRGYLFIVYWKTDADNFLKMGMEK